MSGAGRAPVPVRTSNGSGTVIYFVSAYRALRRRKAWTKKALAEHEAAQPGGSRALPG